MRLLSLFVASAMLFGAACGDDTTDPVPQPGTIAAAVAADPQFSTLKTALDAAELTAVFQGSGPFTVFAPTNAAFEALPEGTLDALLADKDALTRVLQYHVVGSRVDAATVVTLETATTLTGDDITIEVVDGKVVLNGSVNVTTTDVPASNGLIHIIDAVLLPPETEPEDNRIGAIVGRDERFTTLNAAVTAANLGDTLNGAGPFTVFAPTDEAFAALPEGALDALLADTAQLTDVLGYHVVEGDVRAETVVTLPRATASNGVDIDIDVEGTAVTLNGTVNVTITDLIADNGVIHVIDAVLLPPGNIVELAVDDDRFETLVAAVTAANLVDTLSGAGPFTVLAPTDDAFDALPEGTVTALLADIPALTEVLQYHVIAGKNYSEAVAAATTLETLLGEDVTVSIQDGKVFINEAEVIITDIIARNGVIHVLDAVLLPPEPLPTIADVVAGNEDFETLRAALEAASLTETLAGEGPFTVFAPTDAAFAALPEGTVTSLLNDIPALTDVLTYHAIGGNRDGAAVSAENSLVMLNGAVVPVRVEGEDLFIGNAKVTMSVTEVSNGIIHVIDAVLVPPATITDIAVGDERFETLVTALTTADLAGTLDAEGTFTVFAPTDDAFAALPEGVLTGLLGDTEALTDVLLFHVLDGVVPASVAVTATTATAKNGDELALRFDAGAEELFIGPTVTGGEAMVIITDIWARNGVIHVIDAVLVTPAE